MGSSSSATKTRITKQQEGRYRPVVISMPKQTVIQPAAASIPNQQEGRYRPVAISMPQQTTAQIAAAPATKPQEGRYRPITVPMPQQVETKPVAPASTPKAVQRVGNYNAQSLLGLGKWPSRAATIENPTKSGWADEWVWNRQISTAIGTPEKSKISTLPFTGEPPALTLLSAAVATNQQEGRSRPTAVSASKQTKKQSAAPATAKAKGTAVFASSGPTSTTQNAKTVDAWQMLTTSQLEQMEAENEARKKNAAPQATTQGTTPSSTSSTKQQEGRSRPAAPSVQQITLTQEEWAAQQWNALTQKINDAQSKLDAANARYAGVARYGTIEDRIALRTEIKDLEQQIKDLKKERDDPSLLERLSKTLSGTAKEYFGGLTNATGVAAEGQKGTAMTPFYQSEVDLVQSEIEALEKTLSDPTMTEQDIAEINELLQRYRERLATYETVVRAGEGTAQETYHLADELSASGAKEIERAKQGADTIGKIGIDVLSQGAQMGADAALGALSGGGALAPMTIRSFGSGAQEARQNGAELQEAVNYGAASAAVEVLTEKMFDGLAGLYGKGAADDIVEGAIERLTKNEAARHALNLVASAAGESVEELVSGIVNPALKTLYNGKSIGENYSELEAEDVLYDMLIGGILGGVGGAVAQKNTSNTAAIKADTSLFDRAILKNFNEARKNFIAYAKEHFPASVVNKDTGRTIGISRNGLDKFLSGNLYYEKYASGFHIPELIQNATKVAEAGNYHTQAAESIPSYEYYDSPLTIDGADYMAHIRVRNTLVGDKYYGHTISQVESIEIEPSTRASVSDNPAVRSVNIDGSGQHSQSSADADTIAQLSDVVKHERSTSASYSDTLREMQQLGARQSKSYADDLAHVNELLQNAALSPRDQAYIQEDIADAQRSCDAAMKVIVNPGTTAEERTQAVRRAIDALDYARQRINDLGLPATQREASVVQDALADIAEKLKPYLSE